MLRSCETPMFDSIEPPRPAWRSFVVHALLVLLVVPVVGLGNYRLTPFAGAVVALLVGRRLEGKSIRFAWIAGAIVFTTAVAEIATGWDASWAGVSRWR